MLDKLITILSLLFYGLILFIIPYLFILRRKGDDRKRVHRNPYKLEIYHRQISELIKSLEGKTLAGKLFKNNPRTKKAWFSAAEDLLSKMIDIDKDSACVVEARKMIYDNPNIRQYRFANYD